MSEERVDTLRAELAASENLVSALQAELAATAQRAAESVCEAREEQREVCARHLDATPLGDELDHRAREMDREHDRGDALKAQPEVDGSVEARLQAIRAITGQGESNSATEGAYLEEWLIVRDEMHALKAADDLRRVAREGYERGASDGRWGNTDAERQRMAVDAIIAKAVGR